MLVLTNIYIQQCRLKISVLCIKTYLKIGYCFKAVIPATRPECFRDLRSGILLRKIPDKPE